MIEGLADHQRWRVKLLRAAIFEFEYGEEVAGAEYYYAVDHYCERCAAIPNDMWASGKSLCDTCDQGSRWMQAYKSYFREGIELVVRLGIWPARST
jgi:hypothetical protein